MRTVSVELTESQYGSLEHMSVLWEDYPKEKLISIAISEWLAKKMHQECRTGYYGFAVDTEELDTEEHETFGIEGPFKSSEDAMKHAEGIVFSLRGVGIQAEPRVEWEN